MNPVFTSKPFREIMKTYQTPKIAGAPKARFLLLSTILLVGLVFALPSATCAEKKENTGKKFASPEEAIAALSVATAAADTNALRVILGPASEVLLNPDRIQATNELKTFSSALAFAVKPVVSSMPSRRTTLKPGSVNVTE